LTWSDGFYGGRGKRGTLVEKNKGLWQRNVVIINFNVLGGRENEDKRRQENGLEFFSFKIAFFKNISKNQHTQFLVHGHSSWSTFGLHQVRAQRLFKLVY
jgi:hypothetical protein